YFEVQGYDNVDDTVTVTTAGSNLVIQLNSEAQFQTPLEGVNGLRIYTYGGIDNVTIDPHLTIPLLVEGGDGNDTISCGASTTYVDGGQGNDSITLVPGSATLASTTLWPGADTIVDGGEGNDSTAVDPIDTFNVTPVPGQVTVNGTGND